MSDLVHLSRAHMRTVAQVFQHPIAHNLEWRDVVTLFEALGHVEQEHNSHLTVTINGETETFHHPLHKDVATDQEIMDIRHFLEKMGITPQILHIAIDG